MGNSKSHGVHGMQLKMQFVYLDIDLEGFCYRCIIINRKL